MKKNKGITLVALILTIIVLLILAVVAISAVTGNGIIAHAKNAKGDYMQAQLNDLTQLNELNEQIDECLNSNSKSESTINLTGTLWKIPINAFVSSPAEGCYVLDLSAEKIDSSGTYITIMENYISTYLYYYTSRASGLIQFSGGSLNNENQSQIVKYLDFSANYYVITINGGRDANNETLADWLNAYAENITNLQ